MLVIKSSPFGSLSRTGCLIALRLLDESYPRELARLLEMPLFSVQRALGRLERDGLVAARSRGRTRVFRLNPAYFAARELEQLLSRLIAQEPELDKRSRALRRRPRRTAKPL
jgi:DNA-binding transcriptional ArsR family regulator